MAIETVLVVGASGNIGVSVIIASLNTGRNVIALVRNKTSQDKIVQHVGSDKGITFVETDVTNLDALVQVVDQVKEGKLPAFQHVYSTVGHLVWGSLISMSLEDCDKVISSSFYPNFYAYRATIPYLLDQKNPKATWTLITGGLGDMGLAGITGVTQGALYAMAAAGAFENTKTNIRFNEVHLNLAVQYDTEAEKTQRVKASDFARVYQAILEGDMKSTRITVKAVEDIDKLVVTKKLPESPFIDHMLEKGLTL